MVDELHDAATLMADRSEVVDADETLLSADGPRSRVKTRLRRGDLVGRYVVLDQLGEGGMGVVYAAFDPELERRVALKLVKPEPGFSSRGSAGQPRLLREAQALAKLTHPNVVSVYDVGAWQQSVFVAMEFVDGETAAQWIRRRHEHGLPSWREVLSVFVPAGRGLEAAHASGIVHRDFKPENVMISAHDRVLVLDFGLARASGLVEASPSAGALDTLASGTSPIVLPLTVTGSVMGTPAYMSPEQYQAQPTDAASDQFSFCVTLYYALYGERPFAGDTLPELTAAVLGGHLREPPRGTRVPAWLRRVLLRGLAIDPALRYPSMTELLEQLERDPSRRRNRVLAGLGVAAVLGGSAWAARRQAAAEDPCDPAVARAGMAEAWGPAQRDSLQQAFARDAKSYSDDALQRVTGSLDEYADRWVLQRTAACEAGVDAGTEARRDAALRAACLDQRLRRVQALVRLLGDADQQMVALAPQAVADLPDPAVCQDADGVRQAVPVPEDPAIQEQVELLRIRLAEVLALRSTGKLDDALKGLLELLEQARKLGFDPMTAEVLAGTGWLQIDIGEYAPGQARVEEALLIARVHDMDRLAARLLNGLVKINAQFMRFEVAQWQLRELDAMVERLGDPSDLVALALGARGRIARQRGDDDTAVPLFERAVEVLEAQGSASFGLVVAYDDLATSYQMVGRYEDAAEVLQRASEVIATAVGPSHPNRGNLLVQAARVEASRGAHADSVERLEAALEIFEGAYGRQHPNIGAVLNGLGLQLESVGRFEDAIASLRRALPIQVGFFGTEHVQVAIIQQNLGNALRRQGFAAEALALQQQAYATRASQEGHPEDVYQSLDNLADDLRALGRCDEAVTSYQEAIALRAAAGDDTPEDLAYPRMGIGLCELSRGDREAAAATLGSICDDLEAVVEPSDTTLEYLATARLGQAVALGARSEAARQLARQARAWWAKDPAQYSRQLAQVDAWLADGEPLAPLL